MGIQYSGRTGRPYQYVAAVQDTDFADQCGGILVTTKATTGIGFTMKNNSTATIDFPLGFHPGDFRVITALDGATVLEVRISA